MTATDPLFFLVHIRSNPCPARFHIATESVSLNPNLNIDSVELTSVFFGTLSVSGEDQPRPVKADDALCAPFLLLHACIYNASGQLTDYKVIVTP